MPTSVANMLVVVLTSTQYPYPSLPRILAIRNNERSMNPLEKNSPSTDHRAVDSSLLASDGSISLCIREDSADIGFAAQSVPRLAAWGRSKRLARFTCSVQENK